MRIVTLNACGRRGDWPARRDAVRARLAELEPDLIAFQEVVVTAGYDQVRDMVGPGYEIVHHRDREPGGPGDVEPGQGISIASRRPIDAVREVDLNVTPRTAGFACTALVATVGDVVFANHLPSWQLDFERERELQAVAVASALASHEGHVVVAGDFDADPAAASVRFWTGRQSLEGLSVCYRDAWESAHPDEPGHTFTPENPLVADPDWPFRRIDYVLVRCGAHGGPTLAIRGCDLIRDLSDHYGLVADLAAP